MIAFAVYCIITFCIFHTASTLCRCYVSPIAQTFLKLLVRITSIDVIWRCRSRCSLFSLTFERKVLCILTRQWLTIVFSWRTNNIVRTAFASTYDLSSVSNPNSILTVCNANVQPRLRLNFATDLFLYVLSVSKNFHM